MAVSLTQAPAVRSCSLVLMAHEDIAEVVYFRPITNCPGTPVARMAVHDV